MLKSLTFAAATALALAATPALAQDEPEEARTTYAVTMLEFADDADENRWLEIMETYINPAREAAGMAPQAIHWAMLNEDVDIILVAEMPDGMAAFDSHAPAGRMAFVAALTDLVGGEEELEALGDEMDSLVGESNTIYTHTHP